MHRRIPILSLFCGPGGMDLGFEQAGFDSLLAIDNDPAAVETFNRNRRSHQRAVREDLAELKAERLLTLWEEHAGAGTSPRGIIGGPPCQSFSVSNAHKINDDPRSLLPLAYARILDAFNEQFDLDFFLFENVAGLAHKPNSASLDAFLKGFRRAGFDVTTFFLDAVRFGVPQHRNRMFILGVNKDRFQVADFEPPPGRNTIVTVRKKLGGLPDPVFFSRDARPVGFPEHPNHWCMNPRSRNFTNGTLKAGEMRGRSFRVLEWDAPSWTVAYGHREVHVHPNGKRRLSVYESMRLQGFPKKYVLRGTLSDQIRQVSDAVPPPLARELGKRIRALLN